MPDLSSESPTVGKRVAHNYMIRVNRQYMRKLLTGFRGHGSAEFFRQHTDELWTPEFSTLSCAEYGALRRILGMVCRSKHAIADAMIVVTAKELRMHGISLRILSKLGANVPQLKISLITKSGEIKDL